MTIEEIGAKLGFENDKFPVGMRVLVVDDDLTCLKLMEVLLTKCQYEVTTTDQAKVALEMVRENRNRFDIIISDVHMPNMNGFKLLELVGLEMDLPVIMLSANSDPKLVMKGITHGACDYLVKPVRQEELKNIWQHVIRREKSEPKHQSLSNSGDKDQQANGEIASRTCSNGSSDQKGKRPNRMINDDEEGEEEEKDEGDNGTGDDEPRSQKKPRVAWSQELHGKFVSAVYQLGGVKKSYPKKILELMNVEGITRENVASHLQKYRRFLERINSEATHENIVSGLGGTDTSMRTNLSDRVGNLRALASSRGRFSYSAMSPLQTGSMLNRLNTPSRGSLFDISSSSSTLIQANNHGQNVSNSFSILSKFNPIVSPHNQNQLQSSKSTPNMGNINFVGSSIDYLVNAQRNVLPTAQNVGIFGNMSSEPINAITGPNNFYSGVFPKFSSNHSLFSETTDCDLLVPNGMTENNPSTTSHVLNKALDFSSPDVIPRPVHDSRGEGLFDNFVSTKNVVPDLPVNGVLSPFSQSLDQNNGWIQRETGLPTMAFQDSALPTILQHSGNEKLSLESKTKPCGDYFLDQWRSQGGIGDNGYDLDALLSSMTKGEHEGNMMMDGELGIDDYAFGSCL